ncbi:MAG: site-specific integrase [Planctomycetota bacterium]
MAHPPSQRCAHRGLRSPALSQTSIRRLQDYLQERGYATTTIALYLAVAERFRAWLGHPRSRAEPLGEASVAAFIRHCRAKRRLHHVHHLHSGVTHLLKMLKAAGELAGAPASRTTVIDRAVGQYSAYLRATPGLAESTCRARALLARSFLQGKFGVGPLRWDRLGPEDCTRFVAGCAKRLCRKSLREYTSSLRTYLRYLQMQGCCEDRVIAAIPSIPMWKHLYVPRTMTQEQLRTLLACFDRTTPLGRRDYAMVLLMATLGLRAGEVALLQLGDIDWREASLRLASPKSRRIKILPMPARIGRAIAEYLRHGRPSVSHRYVFARHSAPRNLPVTVGLICQACIRAYQRCGFDPTWKGTHILRHTMATQLYQSGATLKDVADLLGHRSIETSTIYVKVHLPALAAVALPWPEVTR